MGLKRGWPAGFTPVTKVFGLRSSVHNGVPIWRFDGICGNLHYTLYQERCSQIIAIFLPLLLEDFSIAKIIIYVSVQIFVCGAIAIQLNRYAIQLNELSRSNDLR